MSRRARALVVMASTLWPAAVPAQSWTDATRSRMVRDALKISPPALRSILEHYDKDLERGMLDPSRHEGEEIHYQYANGKGGLAAVAVEKKVGDIRDLLSKRAPFSQVTYEMGILAHLVADAEYPLNASDADPREPLYRDAYARFVERSLDHIPFVVDRTPPPALTAGDVRGFVRAAAARAGKNYALIGPAFNDDGTPRSPSALDERSVPFGIASLSYSHAASDIAWIWRHVWASIHGDMEGTPYLTAAPPEKVVVPERTKHRPPTARPSPAPAAAAASPAPAASATPAPAAASASPAPAGPGAGGGAP